MVLQENQRQFYPTNVLILLNNEKSVLHWSNTKNKSKLAFLMRKILKIENVKPKCGMGKQSLYDHMGSKLWTILSFERQILGPEGEWNRIPGE